MWLIYFIPDLKYGLFCTEYTIALYNEAAYKLGKVYLDRKETVFPASKHIEKLTEGR